MEHRTAYIAGPMTGYPASNFPLFDLARNALLALGWVVISPADMDRMEGFDPLIRPGSTPLEYESCLQRDEAAIRDCDSIVMIPGAACSPGAKRERKLSESLGHETYRCWWEGTTFHIELIEEEGT